MQGRSLSSTSIWRTTLAAILLSAVILMGPATAHGAPNTQENTLSAISLQGSLPNQHSAHYLGLQPNTSNGVVVLTLAYDPSNVPQLRGKVNFSVLTEHGLRRFLAGSDYRDLGIASGAPMQFEPVGNKMRAAFKNSGSGSYTVIVYNDSTMPISYTLSATGGTLYDDAGQTMLPVPLSAGARTPDTDFAQAASTSLSSPGFDTVMARRLSGDLSNQFSRHYLELGPEIRDGIVNIDFHYDPLDSEELAGKINFWILNEDGVRRMVRGDDPSKINLATGFPTPFSPFANELSAGFKASGDRYTAVTYNNSTTPASYVLSLQGGVLIDRYGQTNESKAAAVEVAAVAQSERTANADDTSVEKEIAAEETVVKAPLGIPFDDGVPSIGTIPARITLTSPQAVTGRLNKAYKYHYLGLEPLIRDGNVALTLDFDPKENQELAENINFWVLTEDNLRRVLAGAHPSKTHLAIGSPVRYGLDRGKLRAFFNASGRGKYTVIVYNNSDIPAQYSLRADGGTLASKRARNELLEVLP